jgi:hypothetical protein
MNIVNLAEYIYKEMDIFFVALNAPVKSNNNGHWFSGNLSFWNLLFWSGLITEQISNPLMGDVKVFKEHSINYKNWVYGITDLDRETVVTNSSNVKTNKAQVARIISILEKYKVKKLCMDHAKVAEEFEKHGYITRNYISGANTYGKVGNYNETEIFEVPFHNASILNKEMYYNQLIDMPIEQIIHAPKDQTKVKPIKSSVLYKNSTSGISIILPGAGNSITARDIKNGTFRITVEFKSFFRPNSGRVSVQVNNNIGSALYTERGSRSDLLRIGKDLMAELSIGEGDSVRITRMKEGLFHVQKI